MKEIAFYIAVLVFAMGCIGIDRKDEKPTEAFAIESADLVDCITFMQSNPSSERFNEALDRYLFLSDSMDYTGVPLTGSLDIKIFENDSVLLYEFIYPTDSVRNQCYDYLTFKGHWQDNKRMRVAVQTALSTDTLNYSKGLFNIALVGDSLPYQDIQNVVVQISEAITEYKNFLGDEWFQKGSNELNDKEIHLIDSIVGVRIQVYHFQEDSQYSLGFETEKEVYQNKRETKKN